MGWREEKELVLTDGQQWWRCLKSAQTQQVGCYQSTTRKKDLSLYLTPKSLFESTQKNMILKKKIAEPFSAAYK